MAAKLNSENISKITEAEKEMTGKIDPVKGGPTAQAQGHAGEQITSKVLHDIAEGEKKVGGERPVSGGPTATAQSILTKGETSSTLPSGSTGKLDSATISKVTSAEKKLTGSDEPVKGGPTARAQAHAGESINSQTLSDVTAGEKEVAGDRVKGGPTSTLQSELAQSRKK